MRQDTAMGKPLIDLSRAMIGVGSDGVVFDDPESPIIVTVGLDVRDRVSSISVVVRHPAGRLSGSGLSRLPLRHMQRLAVAVTSGAASEPWWTAEAATKPAGSRSWPDGHWVRVLAVWAWAERSGRPGGGYAAIADLWGVSARPTARRWLKTARARAGAMEQAGVLRAGQGL